MEKMIRCIAIDKDGEALTELSSNIEKIPFLSLQGVYQNPLEANRILALRGVDLVFIDPDCSPVNGIDFVRSLVHNPLVVFISNNSSYAVDAYSTGVFDYVVKPITLERLLKVASRAYEISLQPGNEIQKGDNIMRDTPYIFIKVDNRMQRFSTSEILFIEGCSDYVKIHTADSRPILATMNMKNIERKLPHSHFCRVHRSYIVSLDKIDSIERKRIRIGERIIPVSNSYFPVLLSVINCAISA